MSNTHLTRDEITTKVIALIKEVTGAEAVTAKTSLTSELDIDSLTMVRVDILIQSHIGLALSADDLEGLNTVDDLVTRLIERGQKVEASDE
jgi:acyl carrier protein